MYVPIEQGLVFSLEISFNPALVLYDYPYIKYLNIVDSFLFIEY